MLIKSSYLLCFLSAVLFASFLTYSSPSFSAENPFNSSSILLLDNSSNTILSADEAFELSVLLESNNIITLMWTIRPAYYLYQKSLSTIINNKTLNSPLPAGVMIKDEFFGEAEVYYDKLIIKVPLPTEDSQNIHLQLRYQGCAEAGYCYPMQQKSVKLTLP